MLQKLQQVKTYTSRFVACLDELSPVSHTLSVVFSATLIISAAVYSSEEAFKKAFLSTVQEVLRGAGSLIGELARFSDSSAGEISHVAAHVNLSYHQVCFLGAYSA